MTPERWRQITEAFHAALAEEGEGRADFLRAACGADPDLRAEVDALLDAHRDAGSFGERPVFVPSAGSGAASATARTLPEAPPALTAPAVPAGTRHPFVAVAGAGLVVMAVALGFGIRSLVVHGAPPSRLTYFFISLVWCAVGLFIGFARPGQRVARLGCLSALATAAVFLEVGVLWSGLNVAPLHTVLGFHFFSVFPDGRLPRSRSWRGMLGLLYAVGGASTAIGLWHGPSVVARLEAGLAVGDGLPALRMPLAIVAFGGAVAGMLTAIVYKYRRSADADQRRRVRWMVYGSGLGLLPNIAYFVVNVVEGDVGPRLSLLTNASSVAIPLCMAYVVARHRVLDISVVVRRGLQYLLARRALQAAVALPLAVLAWALVENRHRTVAQIVTENAAYLSWLAAAAAGLRYRRPLQAWLDRRFFRGQMDREQVLLGLLDDVGRLDSLSELSRLVTSKLDFALHPKAVYLWYRDPGELAAASSSDPLLTPADIPTEGRWLVWLEAQGKTTTLPAPTEAGLTAEEVRWFAEREVQLLVPITDAADRVVGALLLGEKRSEEPYGEEDRRLLQAVARQTAVVRENLRLRARVSEEQRIRHDVLARLDGNLADLLKECPACGACFDGPRDRCHADGQPLVLTLPVARVLDGRYRLERQIGKGGMGAVYEARDLRLGRTVAVKVLLGRGFGQPAALRRFRREAQAAARLNHPNVVSVYDFGSLEGQGAYLVMERAGGVTLRVALRRHAVLPPVAAASWFEPLMDGLAAAHDHGIVHRDLKPENVIGREEGGRVLAVKVLDFGLAKFSATGTAASTATAEGVVLGTLAYMSPEQIFGADLDHRADIYALGVMVSEALTGRPPLEGASLAARAAGVPEGVSAFPGASAAARSMDAVLRRCLARERSDRYPSVAALRPDLLASLQACARAEAQAG